MDRVRIVTKLETRLRELNLTQRDFARRVGMKYTALNYACKSGIRTARVANRYAEALGCRPEELMDFFAEPPHENNPVYEVVWKDKAEDKEK